MKSEFKNTRNVIIIKGAPGAGKTYVSKKLISRLDNPKTALISIDEILHLDQRKFSNDKLKLAKYHTAIMTRSFLREDFDIVIEYTFDIQEHLEFLVDKIRRSHIEQIPEANILIFHLDADLKTLYKRNSSRSDGTDALDEKILEEIFNGCEASKGKIENEIVIDTSKISVKDVVSKIMGHVK